MRETGELATMQLLLAAAHLDNNTLYSQLHERLTNRHRAATLEHGVDIPRLMAECVKARHRENWRRLLVISVAVLGLLVIPVILAYTIIACIELYVHFLRLRYARKYLRSDATEFNFETSQNVVIFGGSSPFAGSGVKVNGWSFVVDVTRPAIPNKPTKSIDIPALLDELSNAIAKLDIPGMSLADRLIIRGNDVRKHKTLLAHQFATPTTSLSVDEIDALMGSGDEHIRRYKAVIIPSWCNQLVHTIYYRIQMFQESLYIEANFCLLTPLKETYLQMANLTERTNARQYIAAMIKCLAMALVSWMEALFLIYVAVAKLVRGDHDRREIQDNHLYNYGWQSALREVWSGPLEHYFQFLDFVMYFKIVQQRILDCTTDALESRGISTEEIKERRTTILNEGVIMSGGTISTSNLTVGHKASTSVRNAPNGTGKIKDKAMTLV